ncbi:hypothetical protein A6R68_14137, partial [Neotoma lepida]
MLQSQNTSCLRCSFSCCRSHLPRDSGRSCALQSNSRFPVGEAPPSEAEAVRPKTSSPNLLDKEHVIDALPGAKFKSCPPADLHLKAERPLPTLQERAAALRHQAHQSYQ